MILANYITLTEGCIYFTNAGSQIRIIAKDTLAETLTTERLDTGFTHTAHFSTHPVMYTHAGHEKIRHIVTTSCKSLGKPRKLHD